MTDQFGQSIGLHLVHDLCAIALNGSDADFKFLRDRMIGQASGHKVKDFHLARCEFAEAALEIFAGTRLTELLAGAG